MPVTIREFRRSDRDQLTALVNLHVGSVLPGTTLSANVVLSQLEREPEEQIVDPWVTDRLCLVAEEGQAVVAATLVHRFASEQSVGQGYRSATRIRWLLFVPGSENAARTLLDAAIDRARGWSPSSIFVESALPAPGCVGVSGNWPHVIQALREAGFTGPDRWETVLACDTDRLAAPELDVGAQDQRNAANGTWTIKRSVGVLGTRLDLMDGEQSLGYIEVAPVGGSLQRSAAGATWADVGNLFPSDHSDLQTVMKPLISAAARWLQLGGIGRLIDYYAPDEAPPGYLEALTALGFTELSVNQRGWQL
jgi:hypothetical protein